MAQTLNSIIVNKLTLAQYKSAKASSSLNTNEVYVISDIDEQLENIVIYKESLDVNSPIILRNLDSGLYKIYGYFKYNSNQSGISGVDPFAYVIVEKTTSQSNVTIIDTAKVERYSITNTTYQNLDDTGWINATLTSNFKTYGSDSNNTPKYRKKDGVVHIRGTVTPSKEITASSTGTTIFTLPSGYRPTYGLVKVCQGSGKNTWCLEAKTNGNVTIARYGTTGNTNIPTNAWLPFDFSFSI